MPRPRGFDYGCLPYVRALSSGAFIDHLGAASVNAIGYTTTWSRALAKEVPVVSLVAQHRDQLAKAFQEFNSWSQMTDSDSVELTFVFRKSGGYILAISPEFTRRERRCIGFDRTNLAKCVGPFWIKSMDSVHPMLKHFKSYCSASIAPFFFTGVTYVGPSSALTPSLLPDLSPIPGLKPLLKFEVTLVNEDAVKPNSKEWLALHSVKEKTLNTPSRTRKPKQGNIAKQRTKTLGQHFPVTLERIRRNPSVPKLMQRLVENDIRPWQTEQALCNLVLSTELGRGAHFSELSPSEARNKIVQAIRVRYELADGGQIPSFSIKEVRKQVFADGNALLKCIGAKTRRNLPAVQTQLKSISALEAGTPVNKPTHWSD